MQYCLNGYTQVECIESTGGQYIDTGVIADSKLRVVLDLAYTNPSGANQNVGAINLAGDDTIRYHLLAGGAKFNVYTNTNSISTIALDTNRHLFDIDVPNGKIYVDDETFNKAYQEFDVGLTFWLFGRNSNSTQYLTSMKLYRSKMYYENILVRDFIPCIRKADNAAGLYDLIGNEFYGTATTKNFIAGNVVTIPNPDFKQEVETTKGKQIITELGKNLLDLSGIPETYTNGGLTFNKKSNGIFNIKGTKTSSDWVHYATNFKIPKFWLNKTVTLFFKKDLKGASVSGNVGFKRGLGTNYFVDVFSQRSNTMTITQEMIDKVNTFDIGIQSTSTEIDIDLEIYALLADETDTAFEEYKKEKVFELDLKSKNFCSSTDVALGSISGGNGANITANNRIRSDFLEIDYSALAITLSAKSNKSMSAVCFLYDTQKNYLGRTSENWQPLPYTFSIENEETKYLKFAIKYVDDTVISNASEIEEIQLEYGTEATEYQEYYNIELAKINNNADIMFKNEKNSKFYNNALDEDCWYKYEPIKKHVFDGGNEDTYYLSADLADVLAVNLNPAGKNIPAQKTGTKIAVYCDKFGYVPHTDNVEHIYITSNTQTTVGYIGAIRLYINHSRLDGYDANLTNAQKLALVTTWLQKNPITAYYISATPVYKKIPATKLTEQLDAILNGKTNNGITNIFIESEEGLQPTMYVKAYTKQEMIITNAGNYYSKPIITIYGSGTINLSLNGSQVFVVELGDEESITIDIDAMNAYNGGVLKNRLVTGNYDNFLLNPGENIISWTGYVAEIEIENYSRWI